MSKGELEAHQVQLNNQLVQFISQLKKVTPDRFHKDLNRYYRHYRQQVDQGKRLDFIADLVERLDQYKEEIFESDEGLFSEEEQYYPGQPIELLKSLDFKLMWQTSHFGNQTKEAIWSYLQNLYLIGHHIIQSGQQVESQQKFLQEMIRSLKEKHEIDQEADRLNQEEDLKASLEGLEGILDEDSVLLKLAKDVSSDFPELMDGEEADLSSLMSMLQKPSQLKELILKVLRKIKDKNYPVDKKAIKAELKKVIKAIQDKVPMLKQLIQQAGGLKVIDQIDRLPNLEELINSLDQLDESNMPTVEDFKQHLSQLGLDDLQELQSSLGIDADVEREFERLKKIS